MHMGRGAPLLRFHPFSNMDQCRCPSDMDAFCCSLSQDLKKLEDSLGEGSISLRWSVEAMRFLKKVHVELLSLLKKSELPVAIGAKEDWFDQYMKETASMLDLCNSLKSAVSGMSRYRMVVGLAMRGFSDESSSVAAASKIEFERLERVCEYGQLRMTERWNETMRIVEDKFGSREFSNRDKCNINTVMVAVKSTVSVISLLLTSAFFYSSSASSVDVCEEQVIQEALRFRPFTASLTVLMARFRERIDDNSSGIALVEHGMVEELIRDIKSLLAQGKVEDMEEVLRIVELLRERSVRLQEGIDLFDALLDEVFQVVIKGRNEMLGTLRDGDAMR